MSAEKRLKELGLELPPVPKPGGNYVGGVKTGNLLFMSGVGPRRADGAQDNGKGRQDADDGAGLRGRARVTGLNMLANIRATIGSLDKVKRVVKTLGMVNADPAFNETPKVINGFSDLFVGAFYGDAGRGARSAVGAW